MPSNSYSWTVRNDKPPFQTLCNIMCDSKCFVIARASARLMNMVIRFFRRKEGSPEEAPHLISFAESQMLSLAQLHPYNSKRSTSSENSLLGLCYLYLSVGISSWSAVLQSWNNSAPLSKQHHVEDSIQNAVILQGTQSQVVKANIRSRSSRCRTSGWVPFPA